MTTADLGTPDGTLLPSPSVDWVVADGGVRLEGLEQATRVGEYAVKRIDGDIRLSSAVHGRLSDGWMGETAAYDRYDATRLRQGRRLARGWGGEDKPGKVTIRLGTLGVGEDRRPFISQVTRVVRDEINSGEELPFLLRAPPGPWRAEVTISPTFSPNELDASLGDTRQLGAQVSFDYVPFTDS